MAVRPPSCERKDPRSVVVDVTKYPPIYIVDRILFCFETARKLNDSRAVRRNSCGGTIVNKHVEIQRIV